jgi:hypothetical protein
MVIQWDGNIITKPGIYKGVPLDLYHSSELFDGVPAISSSGLRKIFNYSPAHYWAESPYNPDRIEPEDKKHFIIGRALHHLVGAERGFKELFVVRPEEIHDPKTKTMVAWNGNRTICKAWVEKQKENGKSVLTAEDVKNLAGMAVAIGKHPLVGVLSGEIEHSYFWRDEETGIWLKWRPDSSPTDSMDFVDLKTTTDVRWLSLVRTTTDNGYHQQGGLGRAAVRALVKRDMNSFSLFYIEKKEPFATALVQMKDADLSLGERCNRAALRNFWHCWKNKEWPGPAESDISHMEISQRVRDETDIKLRAIGL